MAPPAAKRTKPRRCPCSSGRTLAQCCGPLLRRKRQAETCEELMRSRYAAFALREVEYLYDTLHPDHEDRSVGKARFLEEHLRHKRPFRYPGVTIYAHEQDGDAGRVLFFARVFLSGADHSFVELSQFRRSEGAWGYVSGELLPRTDVANTPPVDTFERFERAVAERSDALPTP